MMVITLMQAWRSLAPFSATIRRKTCPSAITRAALEQPLTLRPLVTGCLLSPHARSRRAELSDAKPLRQCAAVGGASRLFAFQSQASTSNHPGILSNSVKSPLLNYRGQTKRVLKLCVSQVIRMWPKVSNLPAIKGTSSSPANSLRGGMWQAPECAAFLPLA